MEEPTSERATDDDPERAWQQHAATRARALGWTGLAAWAGLGLALEAAHGLKLTGYLDDELTRLLLTLAHAHGTLLSIVLVLFAGHGAPLLAPSDRTTSPLLVAGWALLPLGFLLGALAHPESDPGLAIWIVPPAGLLFVIGLARVAAAAWRSAR
jgi:hypothetical protein